MSRAERKPILIGAICLYRRRSECGAAESSGSGRVFRDSRADKVYKLLEGTLESAVPTDSAMGTQIDASAICLMILGAGAIWYLLDYLYVPKQLPNEPPLLSHPIPYIGHMIELLRHGTRYYELTRCVLQYPLS